MYTIACFYFIAHTEKLSRGGLSGKTMCLRMALCVYLFSRGSWKISCQTEKSPLFWSFNPTHMELTLRWSKCFCPRLCKNCTHLIKQSHILILTSFKKPHISLTCNVLMQERMSLSVFSHRAIRVPVSAFIPWRRVIYTKTQNLLWVYVHAFMKSSCTHVSACECHLWQSLS